MKDILLATETQNFTEFNQVKFQNDNNQMDIIEKYFPLREETDKIISAGIEVHKDLGTGFLEIVFKDALEYELKSRQIEYEREKDYIISYKDTILPHKFYADFVAFDSVVLEIKAKDRIADKDIAHI